MAEAIQTPAPRQNGGVNWVVAVVSVGGLVGAWGWLAYQYVAFSGQVARLLAPLGADRHRALPVDALGNNSSSVWPPDSLMVTAVGLLVSAGIGSVALGICAAWTGRRRQDASSSSRHVASMTPKMPWWALALLAWSTTLLPFCVGVIVHTRWTAVWFETREEEPFLTTLQQVALAEAWLETASSIALVGLALTTVAAAWLGLRCRAGASLRARSTVGLSLFAGALAAGAVVVGQPYAAENAVPVPMHYDFGMRWAFTATADLAYSDGPPPVARIDESTLSAVASQLPPEGPWLEVTSHQGLCSIADGGVVPFVGAVWNEPGFHFESATYAELSSSLRAWRRTWQRAHPHETFPGALFVRVSATGRWVLPVLEGMLRDAHAQGYHDVWLVVRRREHLDRPVLGSLDRLTLVAVRARLVKRGAAGGSAISLTKHPTFVGLVREVARQRRAGRDGAIALSPRATAPPSPRNP